MIEQIMCPCVKYNYTLKVKGPSLLLFMVGLKLVHNAISTVWKNDVFQDPTVLMSPLNIGEERKVP